MKAILCCSIAIAASFSLSAQPSGPLNPNHSYASSTGSFSQAWVNTGNVNSSDDNYASFGDLGGKGNLTDYLIASDFGFNLPSGVSILGILVEVERSDPNGFTDDYSIRIVKDGVIGNKEKSTAITYPPTDAYQSYGGSEDMWGEFWSYKDINANAFGVAISARQNADGGITAGRVDNIRVTVYYAFITLPVTLVSFQATKENKTVRVSWNTVSESNMSQYVVERSWDGRFFYPLKNITPANQPTNDYFFIDEYPIAGTSYYRLKMQENSGTNRFSKIIPVHFNKYTTAGLFPSPWTRGKEMFISNPGNETLTIEFYNAEGQVVGKASTSSQQVPMPVLSNTKGVIYYRVKGENNNLKGLGSILVY